MQFSTFFAPVTTYPVLACAVLLTVSKPCVNPPARLDFLWAGRCLLGAVRFIFRA